MPELGKMTVLIAGDAAPLNSEILSAERQLAQSADRMKASLGGIDDMFVSIADSANAMTTSITAGFEKITTMSGKLREEQAAVASSYERTAEAAKVAGDEGVSAAEKATAAAADAATAQKDVQRQYERTGAAAQASSDAQARGAAAAAAGATNAGRAAETAAKKTEAAFGASSSSLTKWGGRIALGLTAGVVGAEALAVKFQSLTTLLNTQAGASVKHVHELSSGILKMSGEVAQSPNHLAEAMYHVVSAMNKVLPVSQQVSKELEVQRAAAMGAAIGHANLDQTTYALSSAMMSLGAANHSAYEMMGSLNAIVGVGDMRMQEFVTSLRSGVIPSATNFGVSLNSMGAALAYLTDRGMPAVVAATRLRMAMTMMGAPTKQAAGELEAIGMSAGQVHAATTAMSEALTKSGVRVTTLAHDMRQPDGIQVALQDLMDHLKSAGLNAEASGALLARAFGGARSGSAIMTLVQHLDQLKSTYEAVNKQQHSFGSDWHRTQETLQFQLKQIESTALSLGTQLGTILIPPTEHLLNDLKEVATWFGKNEWAVKALGGALGTFAAVAIGSYFVSKVKGAISLLKELGSAATSIGRFVMGGSWSPTSTGTSATAGVGNASSVLREGMGIGGARSGFGLPGSMANPLIVALIDGQMAGLGGNAAGVGRSAETRAGSALAEGETMSPGGVVLPPGVNATESAAAGTAEEAVAATAGASLGKSLLGTLGSGLSSLLRGGLVAGTGLMAAQLGGSVVGGSTGKAISSYGSAAAIGAGIGSAIEPGIGTAIGAALGPAVLALKEASGKESRAEAAANHALRNNPNYGKTASDELNKEIRGLWEAADTEIKRFKGHTELSHAGPVTVHSNEEMKKIGRVTEATQYQEGIALGSTEAKYIAQGPQFLNFESIVRTAKKKMEELAPAARDGYFNAIRAMVDTLEKEGRLPEHSWDRLNQSIKTKWKDLGTFSESAAVESMKSWELALKGTGALQSANEFVGKVLGDNKKLVISANTTTTEANNFFRERGNELLEIIKTSSGKRKSLAEHDYSELRSLEKTYHAGVKAETESALSQINQRTAQLSKLGAKSFVSNWNEIDAAIENTMQRGLISATEGSKLIAKELADAFKALGIKPNFKGMESFVSGATGSVTSFLGKGFAEGGYIGQQGSVGPDDQVITAAKGEAVINRHQIPYVQMGLKAIGMQGGLPELFNRVTTPHQAPGGPGYAQGGPVGGPAELAAMIAEANRINAEHLPYAWGGGHGTAGVPSVGAASSSGGPPMLGYDCSGSVSAVLHAGGLLARPEVSGELMNWGLPGPGAVTVYANPIHTFMSLDGRFFGTHGADGAGWYGGAALPGFTQRHAPGIGKGSGSLSPKLKEPRTNLGGLLGQFVQGSDKDIRQAAQTALEREVNSQMMAGGKSGGGDWGTMPHGGIMKIAEFAAHADGVPWEPNLVRDLLSKESSGGQNLAPHNFGGGLDPAGPFQVISSTFNAYAKPGHHNRMNPLDNALAAFAYIKSRYGTMQKLAQMTGLLGSGYKGYAGGGQAGTGGGQGSPGHTAALAKSKSQLAKGRKRHKGKGHHSNPNTSIKALTSAFKLYPDVENLPEVGSGFESELSIFDQQYNLLSQIEQDPHGAFIMPEDMQYLTPTFPPNLDVGWDTLHAKRVNEEAIGAAGEATPELTLQGQLLEWITGQDSHHLLTGGDMGILGSTLIDGIPIHAGMNILQAQYLNRQFEEGAFKSERGAYEKAMKLIAGAIKERENRKALVERVSALALLRKKKIEQKLERLSVIAAQRRVHKANSKLSLAEAKSINSELIFDAQSHKEAIGEALAFERQKPTKDRDKNVMNRLEDESRSVTKEIHDLKSPSTSVSSAKEAVTTAYEKLLDTQLKQQLKPINSNLSILGGSTSKIGTGGEIGKIIKDMHGLSSGAEKFQSAILTINTASLPGLALDFRSIQDASETPIAPTLPKSSASTSEKEALLGPALEEKLRLVEQENLVLKAQMPVFKELIGSFAVGTTNVPRTGPALVHEGEAIIPKSLNPFIGPTSPLGGGIELHLHGELGDFVTRVESVVDGKKRDITEHVNATLGRNAGAHRLLPVGGAT